MQAALTIADGNEQVATAVEIERRTTTVADDGTYNYTPIDPAIGSICEETNRIYEERVTDIVSA